MSENRVDLPWLLVPVVVLYAMVVEWAATQWFGQSHGMSGPAIVTLMAVWVWLAQRRIAQGNGPTATPRATAMRVLARTAAPALALATALLLPQLVFHRWREVMLVAAGIGIAIRMWRRDRPSAPGPGPRPNDR